MTAPIVYRWDDANAPVAAGVRTSMCSILHACLVTGYGDKLPAGWTREFANATGDKAVFRNNPATGTGFFLQIDATATAYTYQFGAKGFEVMSSIDTGIGPFQSSGQVGQTSSSANATARPWVLIADDRAFYFVCWTSATTTPSITDISTCAMFFGDIISRYSVDNYACGLMCNAPSGAWGNCIASSVASGIPGNSAVLMPKRNDGTGGPLLAPTIRGGGPGGDGYMGQLGLPYVAGDQILITRPHVGIDSSYAFRGFLPGFWYPCHPDQSFAQLATITVETSTFLTFRTALSGYSQQRGQYFISLDDWWA